MTPIQPSITPPLHCSSTTTAAAVLDCSASIPSITTHITLEERSNNGGGSAPDHALVEEKQNLEKFTLLAVPSENKEEDFMSSIISSENQEKEEIENDDAMPLIVPAQIPSNSALLCMADEDEDVKEEAFLTPLLPSSASISSLSSNHTCELDGSVKTGANSLMEESKPFQPLIEIMSSAEAEEEGKKVSEDSVSTNMLPPQTRKCRALGFKLSDPVQLADDKQDEERWVTRGTSTSDNHQKWAVSVTQSELQTSIIESSKVEVDRLVIDDLQQEKLTLSLPVSLPVPKEQEQDFKLSDVPILSKDTVRRVDTILSNLKGKAEGEMTREEKVWKLAASGGSTLQEEAVTIDVQTMERVKKSLKEVGRLDQVSLKF